MLLSSSSVATDIAAETGISSMPPTKPSGACHGQQPAVHARASAPYGPPPQLHCGTGLIPPRLLVRCCPSSPDNAVDVACGTLYPRERPSFATCACPRSMSGTGARSERVLFCITVTLSKACQNQKSCRTTFPDPLAAEASNTSSSRRPGCAAAPFGSSSPCVTRHNVSVTVGEQHRQHGAEVLVDPHKKWLRGVAQRSSALL